MKTLADELKDFIQKLSALCFLVLFTMALILLPTAVFASIDLEVQPSAAEIVFGFVDTFEETKTGTRTFKDTNAFSATSPRNRFIHYRLSEEASFPQNKGVAIAGPSQHYGVRGGPLICSEKETNAKSNIIRHRNRNLNSNKRRGTVILVRR